MNIELHKDTVALLIIQPTQSPWCGSFLPDIAMNSTNPKHTQYDGQSIAPKGTSCDIETLDETVNNSFCSRSKKRSTGESDYNPNHASIRKKHRGNKGKTGPQIQHASTSTTTSISFHTPSLHHTVNDNEAAEGARPSAGVNQSDSTNNEMVSGRDRKLNSAIIRSRRGDPDITRLYEDFLAIHNSGDYVDHMDTDQDTNLSDEGGVALEQRITRLRVILDDNFPLGQFNYP